MTQPHDFDPLFKVLLVIFQLGTGQHSIRLEKMILGCKFHILGIKTTFGQHIAKNLPVYLQNASQSICVIVWHYRNMNGSSIKYSGAGTLGKWYKIPHFPGCFCPWTFFVNIGFNTVPMDTFMSHLATQLGYSAGQFQALQLIVLAPFCVVD